MQAVLVERLSREIQQWGDKTYEVMRKISCPDKLSFWIADNIPMSRDCRIYIIGLHSTVQRLRFELHLLQKVCGLFPSASAHQKYMFGSESMDF